MASGNLGSVDGGSRNLGEQVALALGMLITVSGNYPHSVRMGLSLVAEWEVEGVHGTACRWRWRTALGTLSFRDQVQVFRLGARSLHH